MLLDTQPYKVPPVEAPIEPWRQLLLDAADLIERKGWWDGTYPLWQDHHCVRTALLASAPSFDVEFKAVNNFTRYVGIENLGIPNWNDTPGRTKEEVLAAMRGAARS